MTQKLPNITGALPRSFAGNIPVNRQGHPNDTLFFWGFEKEDGSLTAAAGERDQEPWGIWLNGGCVLPPLAAAIRFSPIELDVPSPGLARPV